MSQTAAIRLVKSLSKSEKRHFKLFTKKQSGNKDYLDLFDLIDQNNLINKETLAEKFKKNHPASSVDNTACYLLKVLSDCLIQTKVKEDSLYQLLHGLLRINIFKERNLPKEGYKELKRLQQIAINSQEQLIQYILYRYELNYLAEINFDSVSENHLVEIQMQAREVLKNIRNTHEHYCLYELLKNRLIYQGKAVSENDRKKLNDLLLSEMSIVSAKTKNSLESRKLHLLFQSFFFTDIGDYKSALKTFHELNRLFEKNAALWRHPPLDYLSSLDGILDSLRTIGCYEEMDFYISKLEQLDNPAYPEYFCFIVRKSLMIYRLTVLLNAGQWDRALQLISKSDPNLYKTYTLVDDDKQNELLFCIALTYFKAKNLKKSQKQIQEIVLLGKIDHQSMIYKASRLLNMLIHYEEKDLEYLDYEIRSYKRSVKGNRKLLQTEKIIFKVIKINPDFNPSRKNTILWSPIASAIESIEQDKYEMQLGKYFDFTGWIKDKFGK
jgi:hypothetical protein